jgi:hypothetical protein
MNNSWEFQEFRNSRESGKKVASRLSDLLGQRVADFHVSVSLWGAWALQICASQR